MRSFVPLLAGFVVIACGGAPSGPAATTTAITPAAAPVPSRAEPPAAPAATPGPPPFPPPPTRAATPGPPPFPPPPTRAATPGPPPFPPPPPPRRAAPADAAPGTTPRQLAVFERAARVATARTWTTQIDVAMMVAFGPDPGAGRFRPAFAIQYRAEGDGAASDDAGCRELATTTAAMRNATVEAAAAVAFGAGRGCRIQIASPTTTQAAVQYALSRAGESVSVLCSRDKRGDADADAICLEVVRAIWID